MRRIAGCGFTDDGRRYSVRDVHALSVADGDLWNDRMALQIDQCGRVLSSGFMQPNMTAFSLPLRCFYVRDDATGAIWSAPYEPVRAEPDAFEFSIGRADLRWTAARDGIRVRLDCVIPRDDTVELWRAEVTNVSRRRRRVSLFSLFPVGRRSLLAQRAVFEPALGAAVHEFFEYYAKIEDYERIKTLRNLVFCAADPAPAAWELSLPAFHGGRGLHAPAQLDRRRLPSNRAPWEAANEETANVLQFPVTLAPGASRAFHFVFGPAQDREEIRALRRRYLRPGALDAARRKVEAFLDAHAPAVRVRTPDADFNHYLNVWLPRRSLAMVRTLRHNMAPQGRNVIQDAMGGVFTDPAASRHWFQRIWAHQHTSGWLPHGMPFEAGVAQVPINAIPHKDINSWGPTAVGYYIKESGDEAILDTQIPFADRPARVASLYEHIAMGLDWLLRDRTRRGLCRLGQGDWCDPLNMAGMREKGESVWLSEALVFALHAWAEVAERRGERASARRWRKEAARLRTTINRLAWDGQWYARGFKDDGAPFGVRACRAGRIFINAQSWGILSGVATPRRTAAIVRSVERLLDSPSGAMKLAPPYTAMDESIGKLTQKIPGWNENGSVYCHATTFYAYALYSARRADLAFRVLRELLPGYGRNTLERAQQVPLYIPNFYRGMAAGERAGLSSRSGNTGTVSWYARTAVGMLLGVRADYDALVIDPQLPSHWRWTEVVRVWRGAEFRIAMRRRRGVRAVEVRLNGRAVRGGRIPVQSPGTTHAVEVLLPA